MPPKDIHFEVFCRQSADETWVLHDVATVREKAIGTAATLVASKQAKSAKVVRQSYDGETGDYASVTVFEDGLNKLELDPEQEEMPSAAPCFKPEDLYTRQARATLTRLLRGHLTRHKLTVTELMHRADALQKLESAGTTFQHAVQKVAVAQASSSNKPVQQIIKALNELSSKAIARVYRDQQRGYFPAVKEGGFGALADKLGNAADGLYVLNGALARHLSSCKSWDEKIKALLAVVASNTESDYGRALLCDAVDTVIAEILGSSAALFELMGERENLGQALMVLSHLFLGILNESEAQSETLMLLAEEFAGDSLPSARAAIADRIIAELKNTRRLCPASRLIELSMLRKLDTSLTLGGSRYLNRDDLLAAFTLRSRRLLSNEALADYLSGAENPDDKLERLLRVEEGIAGAENKKQLGSVVQQIISAPAFEDYFVTNTTPVMTRLRRLADLQLHVHYSSFLDHHREAFSDRLDAVAHEVESRGRVLKSLQDTIPGPAERAMAILKLFAHRALTEGRVAGRARDLLLSSLRQPGFLAGYVARVKANGESVDPERTMAELVESLERAGISREAGLRSIAA